MGRRPLMGGNWKLNPKTVAGAQSLAADLAKLIAGVKDVDVCVFPAHPHLAPVQVSSLLGLSLDISTPKQSATLSYYPRNPQPSLSILSTSFSTTLPPQDKIKGSNISLGGQNCYFMSEGAYTGAVSTCMLKDIGVKYVLAGSITFTHSHTVPSHTV